MFSYILAGLYAVPLLFCIFQGNAGAVSSLMTGADEAVRFCISAAGGLCFWCAVTELFEQCAAAGSKTPFDILPAVWAVSALSLLAGLSAASVLKRLWK